MTSSLLQRRHNVSIDEFEKYIEETTCAQKLKFVLTFKKAICVFLQKRNM